MIFIFLFLILVVIIGIYYIYTKPEREKENERKYVENKFINDFISVLDKEAPFFKHIRISLSSRDNNIEIVDKNGQKLIYNCEQHGFVVSSGARQRLVEELKSRYNALAKPGYGTSYENEAPPIEVYYITAHKGIDEENEKKQQQNKIRKC